MRHLLNCWHQVSERLRNAEGVALFLDYDGTLAPLRARPEDALLHPATRRALLRLVRHPRLSVWVISGRRLADVRQHIRVPGVRYLGLHGSEGNRMGKLSEAARSHLVQARHALAGRIQRATGVWVEDKDTVFAMHYRGVAKAAVKEATAVLREVLGPFTTRLRLVQGNNAWEVLPRELGDKGVAARREWRTFRRNALPVYIGNDASDEPAFTALARGITVNVGPRRRSRARFRLRSPTEVRRFLEKLEAELW